MTAPPKSKTNLKIVGPDLEQMEAVVAEAARAMQRRSGLGTQLRKTMSR